MDLTRARRHALQHYWNERFDAASRLAYIAPVIGLRNSRLVEGDYVLTALGAVAALLSKVKIRTPTAATPTQIINSERDGKYS